ncbi:hypothetical protein KDK77_07950, partial [bacterium]|nr:hypothetical protein [bacterium]
KGWWKSAKKRFVKVWDNVTKDYITVNLGTRLGFEPFAGLRGTLAKWKTLTLGAVIGVIPVSLYGNLQDPINAAMQSYYDPIVVEKVAQSTIYQNNKIYRKNVKKFAEDAHILDNQSVSLGQRSSSDTTEETYMFVPTNVLQENEESRLEFARALHALARNVGVHIPVELFEQNAELLTDSYQSLVTFFLAVEQQRLEQRRYAQGSIITSWEKGIAEKGAALVNTQEYIQRLSSLFPEKSTARQGLVFLASTVGNTEESMDITIHRSDIGTESRSFDMRALYKVGIYNRTSEKYTAAFNKIAGMTYHGSHDDNVHRSGALERQLGDRGREPIIRLGQERNALQGTRSWAMVSPRGPLGIYQITSMAKRIRNGQDNPVAVEFMRQLVEAANENGTLIDRIIIHDGNGNAPSSNLRDSANWKILVVSDSQNFLTNTKQLEPLFNQVVSAMKKRMSASSKQDFAPTLANVAVIHKDAFRTLEQFRVLTQDGNELDNYNERIQKANGSVVKRLKKSVFNLKVFLGITPQNQTNAVIDKIAGLFNQKKALEQQRAAMDAQVDAFITQEYYVPEGEEAQIADLKNAIVIQDNALQAQEAAFARLEAVNSAIAVAEKEKIAKEERLKSLRDQKKTLSEDIATLPRRYKQSMSEQKDAIRQNKSSISEQIAVLQTMLQTVESDSVWVTEQQSVAEESGIQNLIDAVSLEIQALDARKTALNQQIDSLKKQLDALNKEEKALSAEQKAKSQDEIDTFQAEQRGAHQEYLSAFESQQTAIENHRQAFVVQQQNFELHVSFVTEPSKQVQKKIDQMRRSFTDQNRMFVEQQERVNTQSQQWRLQGELLSLRETPLQEQIDARNQRLSEINTELETLLPEIKTIAQSLEGYTKERAQALVDQKASFNEARKAFKEQQRIMQRMEKTGIPDEQREPFEAQKKAFENQMAAFEHQETFNRVNDAVKTVKQLFTRKNKRTTLFESFFPLEKDNVFYKLLISPLNYIVNHGLLGLAGAVVAAHATVGIVPAVTMLISALTAPLALMGVLSAITPAMIAAYLVVGVLFVSLYNDTMMKGVIGTLSVGAVVAALTTGIGPALGVGMSLLAAPFAIPGFVGLLSSVFIAGLAGFALGLIPVMAWTGLRNYTENISLFNSLRIISRAMDSPVVKDTPIKNKLGIVGAIKEMEFIDQGLGIDEANPNDPFPFRSIVRAIRDGSNLVKDTYEGTLDSANMIQRAVQHGITMEPSTVDEEYIVTSDASPQAVEGGFQEFNYNNTEIEPAVEEINDEFARQGRLMLDNLRRAANENPHELLRAVNDYITQRRLSEAPMGYETNYELATLDDIKALADLTRDLKNHGFIDVRIRAHRNDVKILGKIFGLNEKDAMDVLSGFWSEARWPVAIGVPFLPGTTKGRVRIAERGGTIEDARPIPLMSALLAFSEAPWLAGLSAFNILDTEADDPAYALAEDTKFGIMGVYNPPLYPNTPAISVHLKQYVEEQYERRLFGENSYKTAAQVGKGFSVLHGLQSLFSHPIFTYGASDEKQMNWQEVMSNVFNSKAMKRDEIAYEGAGRGSGWINYIIFGYTLYGHLAKRIGAFPPGVGQAVRQIQYIQELNNQLEGDGRLLKVIRYLQITSKTPILNGLSGVDFRLAVSIAKGLEQITVAGKTPDMVLDELIQEALKDYMRGLNETELAKARALFIAGNNLFGQDIPIPEEFAQKEIAQERPAQTESFEDAEQIGKDKTGQDQPEPSRENDEKMHSIVQRLEEKGFTP